MKTALLLYPHQLYPVHELPKVDTVVVMEDPLYFGRDQEFPLQLHKQKLILHRASMRRYVEEVLWPADLKVEYIDLDVFMQSGEVLDRVKDAEQIFVIDPTDEVLTRRLLQARRERTDLPNLTFLPSPNFYLKESELRQFFKESHKQPFADFYQWQRERFNVLIGGDYKPVGDKWCLESGAPRKLAADLPLPSFPVYGDNPYVADATKWVNEHFPDNPGSTDFIWPTNHTEATEWLTDFVANRLDTYADYANTIDPRSPWLFHSLLASSLNVGLLTPQQIVQAAIDRHTKQPVPLESLELFVRQVLGWREFTRGQYLTSAHEARSHNPLGHKRKLTAKWYQGTTGIPPFDDLVKKLISHSYAHQSEQRMVAANLMLLCEIQPDEMYRWFNELCLDSYDWTIVPAVYGEQLFAAGDADGVPPVTPSADLMNMSPYTHDIWADIWDGLFWRFVEKHQTALGKNPHTRHWVGQFKKLDDDYRRIVHYRAEDFLNQFTTL